MFDRLNAWMGNMATATVFLPVAGAASDSILSAIGSAGDLLFQPQISERQDMRDPVNFISLLVGISTLVALKIVVTRSARG